VAVMAAPEPFDQLIVFFVERSGRNNADLFKAIL
jgi:hypothetical protein